MNNLALHAEILATLQPVYGFVKAGDKLRKGECPVCKKRELWTDYENPWVLRCPRQNNCGADIHVKEAHAEIFERLNERYPATTANPNATADRGALLNHSLKRLNYEY